MTLRDKNAVFFITSLVNRLNVAFVSKLLILLFLLPRNKIPFISQWLSLRVAGVLSIKFQVLLVVSLLRAVLVTFLGAVIKCLTTAAWEGRGVFWLSTWGSSPSRQESAQQDCEVVGHSCPVNKQDVLLRLSALYPSLFSLASSPTFTVSLPSLVKPLQRSS